MDFFLFASLLNEQVEGKRLVVEGYLLKPPFAMVVATAVVV